MARVEEADKRLEINRICPYILAWDKFRSFLSYPTLALAREVCHKNVISKGVQNVKCVLLLKYPFQ